MTVKMSSADISGDPANVTHPTYLQIQEYLKKMYEAKFAKCELEVLSQPAPNDGK